MTGFDVSHPHDANLDLTLQAHHNPASNHPAMKIGYCRVSTQEQNLDLQEKALQEAADDPLGWTISSLTDPERI